jgi:hypothetical protein
MVYDYERVNVNPTPGKGKPHYRTVRRRNGLFVVLSGFASIGPILFGLMFILFLFLAIGCGFLLFLLLPEIVRYLQTGTNLANGFTIAGGPVTLNEPKNLIGGRLKSRVPNPVLATTNLIGGKLS